MRSQLESNNLLDVQMKISQARERLKSCRNASSHSESLTGTQQVFLKALTNTQGTRQTVPENGSKGHGPVVQLEEFTPLNFTGEISHTKRDTVYQKK